MQSVLEMRHDRVIIQKWDLSCGAAALATLLRYQFGEPVTEREIAGALMGRAEYVEHPELIQVREDFLSSISSVTCKAIAAGIL